MTRWVASSKRECSQLGSCQGGGYPRERVEACNSGSDQGTKVADVLKERASGSYQEGDCAEASAKKVRDGKNKGGRVNKDVCPC